MLNWCWIIEAAGELISREKAIRESSAPHIVTAPLRIDAGRDCRVAAVIQQYSIIMTEDHMILNASVVGRVRHASKLSFNACN